MNKELQEAQKTLRSTRKWIFFLVVVLGVLLVTIIALVIWAVITETKKPTSFAECVSKKDAKILESYPEQCVVDGVSFTNPNQKVEEAAPEPEPLTSADWLIYVPDDETYTIKLIDGWNFESVDVGVAEVLTACVEDCTYNESSPAQLVNKKGVVNEDAKLRIVNGKNPILVDGYLASGTVTLDEGGVATRYVYNEGEVTNYVYIVKGSETTVMVTYSQSNSTTANNLPYIEEMVSTITLE
jgi:hypothetical protein